MCADCKNAQAKVGKVGTVQLVPSFPSNLRFTSVIFVRVCVCARHPAALKELLPTEHSGGVQLDLNLA